jgi:hypothetical protein
MFGHINKKNPFLKNKSSKKLIKSNQYDELSKRKFNRAINDNDKWMTGSIVNNTSNGVINTYDEDSYVTISEEKEEIKLIKEKNYFGYTKNSRKDMQQIFKRIGDINVLENNLFKSNNIQNISMKDIKLGAVSTNFFKSRYNFYFIR